MFKQALFLALLTGCAATVDEPSRPGPLASSAYPSEPSAAFEAKWTEASGQMQNREYGRALTLFEQAVELAVVDGIHVNLISARSLVARMLSATGNLPKARAEIESVKAASAGHDPEQLARVMQVDAIITREEGDREGATQMFIELYDFCIDTEQWSAAIDAAHHVAIAADLETQVLWARKGITAAEAAGDHGWLAALWNNLGVTYEDLERPVDVIACYEQARIYHYETGGPVQKLAADWAVGHGLVLNKDYDRAEVELLKSLAAAEARYAADPTPRTAEWIAYNLQELARVERGRGDLKVALVLMERCVVKWAEAELESWEEGSRELASELATLRFEVGE